MQRFNTRGIDNTYMVSIDENCLLPAFIRQNLRGQNQVITVHAKKLRSMKFNEDKSVVI